MSIRYPNDAIDRFWWRFGTDASHIEATSQTIRVGQKSYDLHPENVMQTNYVSNTTVFTFDPSKASPILTTSTLLGSHYYFVVLGFVELYPNVTAGMRVFDLAINRDFLADTVDIYNQVGRYTAYEIYSPTNKALGPYVDNVVIAADAKSYSTYSPSVAAEEVFQLFDNPVNATNPTSSTDRKSHCVNICYSTISP